MIQKYKNILNFKYYKKKYYLIIFTFMFIFHLIYALYINSREILLLLLYSFIFSLVLGTIVNEIIIYIKHVKSKDNTTN